MNDTQKFWISTIVQSVLGILAIVAAIFTKELNTYFTSINLMWLYVILKYALLAGWVWSLVRLFTIKKLIEIDKLRKEIKSISKGENNTNDAEIENLKHQVEILRYLYFMKNRIQTEVLVGDSNKHYLNQTLNNQPYSSNVTDRPRIEEYIGQGIDSKEKVATIVSKFFTINAKNL